MSTLKRVTVLLEPEVYRALHARSLALQRSVSELINDAVRSAMLQAGTEIPAANGPKKASATFERLAQALKRRRQSKQRPKSPRS
jgi:hypothetical protein